jgi:hypothetical protein
MTWSIYMSSVLHIEIDKSSPAAAVEFSPSDYLAMFNQGYRCHYTYEDPPYGLNSYRCYAQVTHYCSKDLRIFCDQHMNEHIAAAHQNQAARDSQRQWNQADSRRLDPANVAPPAAAASATQPAAASATQPAAAAAVAASNAAAAVGDAAAAAATGTSAPAASSSTRHESPALVPAAVGSVSSQSASALRGNANQKDPTALKFTEEDMRKMDEAGGVRCPLLAAPAQFCNKPVTMYCSSDSAVFCDEHAETHMRTRHPQQEPVTSNSLMEEAESSRQGLAPPLAQLIAAPAQSAAASSSSAAIIGTAAQVRAVVVHSPGATTAVAANATSDSSTAAAESSSATAAAAASGIARQPADAAAAAASGIARQPADAAAAAAVDGSSDSADDGVMLHDLPAAQAELQRALDALANSEQLLELRRNTVNLRNEQYSAAQVDLREAQETLNGFIRVKQEPVVAAASSPSTETVAPANTLNSVEQQQQQNAMRAEAFNRMEAAKDRVTAAEGALRAETELVNEAEAAHRECQQQYQAAKDSVVVQEQLRAHHAAQLERQLPRSLYNAIAHAVRSSFAPSAAHTMSDADIAKTIAQKYRDCLMETRTQQGTMINLEQKIPSGSFLFDHPDVMESVRMIRSAHVYCGPVETYNIHRAFRHYREMLKMENYQWKNGRAFRCISSCFAGLQPALKFLDYDINDGVRELTASASPASASASSPSSPVASVSASVSAAAAASASSSVHVSASSSAAASQFQLTGPMELSMMMEFLSKFDMDFVLHSRSPSSDPHRLVKLFGVSETMQSAMKVSNMTVAAQSAVALGETPPGERSALEEATAELDAASTNHERSKADLAKCREIIHPLEEGINTAYGGITQQSSAEPGDTLQVKVKELLAECSASLQRLKEEEKKSARSERAAAQKVEKLTDARTDSFFHSAEEDISRAMPSCIDHYAMCSPSSLASLLIAHSLPRSRLFAHMNFLPSRAQLPYTFDLIGARTHIHCLSGSMIVLMIPDIGDNWKHLQTCLYGLVRAMINEPPLENVDSPRLADLERHVALMSIALLLFIKGYLVPPLHLLERFQVIYYLKRLTEQHHLIVSAGVPYSILSVGESVCRYTSASVLSADGVSSFVNTMIRIMSLKLDLVRYLSQIHEFAKKFPPKTVSTAWRQFHSWSAEQCIALTAVGRLLKVMGEEGDEGYSQRDAFDDDSIPEGDDIDSDQVKRAIRVCSPHVRTHLVKTTTEALLDPVERMRKLLHLAGSCVLSSACCSKALENDQMAIQQDILWDQSFHAYTTVDDAVRTSCCNCGGH